MAMLIPTIIRAGFIRCIPRILSLDMWLMLMLMPSGFGEIVHPTRSIRVGKVWRWMDSMMTTRDRV